MRTIKTYFKRAPFYNALIRGWHQFSARETHPVQEFGASFEKVMQSGSSGETPRCISLRSALAIGQTSGARYPITPWLAVRANLSESLPVRNCFLESSPAV